MQDRRKGRLAESVVPMGKSGFGRAVQRTGCTADFRMAGVPIVGDLTVRRGGQHVQGQENGRLESQTLFYG